MAGDPLGMALAGHMLHTQLLLELIKLGKLTPAQAIEVVEGALLNLELFQTGLTDPEKLLVVQSAREHLEALRRVSTPSRAIALAVCNTTCITSISVLIDLLLQPLSKVFNPGQSRQAKTGSVSEPANRAGPGNLHRTISGVSA